MSKDNGYWVRVLDEEKANILISLGFSCCSDVAIIKVVEDKCREGFAYWVEDYMVKLDKPYLRPLSSLEALNLKMEHNAKWREICADCISNELIDKMDARKKLFEEYEHTDKSNDSRTNENEDMKSILDLFRKQSELFDNFTEAIRNIKFETSRRNVQLPDEIDLYNFFEKWGGRATCSYVIDYDVFPYHDEGSVVAKSISALEDAKGYCDKIEYDIQHNRYYAIKFKDRGTFLVSEKRYNELKTKKGE